jgi:cobalamin biosynthesis protein CobT
MQLTMVPKFKLPPIPAQEFIFVVDRSGSMSGARIETAKRTLKILLRMLPSSLTTFNIVSFGTRADSIWPSSQGYTQDTLDYGVNFI